MSNRLDLLSRAKYIQDTYGEDTIASLFAKDVEEFLHSLHHAPFGTYSAPLVASTTPAYSHPTPVEWTIEEDDKSFTWKAD